MVHPYSQAKKKADRLFCLPALIYSAMFWFAYIASLTTIPTMATAIITSRRVPDIPKALEIPLMKEV